MGNYEYSCILFVALWILLLFWYTYILYIYVHRCWMRNNFGKVYLETRLFFYSILLLFIHLLLLFAFLFACNLLIFNKHCIVTVLMKMFICVVPFCVFSLGGCWVLAVHMGVRAKTILPWAVCGPRCGIHSWVSFPWVIRSSVYHLYVGMYVFNYTVYYFTNRSEAWTSGIRFVCTNHRKRSQSLFGTSFFCAEFLKAKEGDMSAISTRMEA